MSTMVVQERHLWLNLAERKDVVKARFLDAPHLPGGAVQRHRQGLLPSSSRRHHPPLPPGPDLSLPVAVGALLHPPASSRAARPQAESIPRPARRASRRRAASPASQPGPKSSRKSMKRPWCGQPGDVGVCSFLGDGENSAAPSPGGGSGGESCVSFYSVPPLVQGTFFLFFLKERAISFSSGFSGPWDDCVRGPASSLSPTTHFCQQPREYGSGTMYSAQCKWVHPLWKVTF